MGEPPELVRGCDDGSVLGLGVLADALEEWCVDPLVAALVRCGAGDGPAELPHNGEGNGFGDWYGNGFGVWNENAIGFSDGSGYGGAGGFGLGCGDGIGGGHAYRSGSGDGQSPPWPLTGGP